MNLEQLKYIVEVANTKSITIAAQNLHVSQSGISKAISSLEQELGILLFNRSRSGAVPSADGKELIQKAFEIVTKLIEFEEHALEKNREINGALKIAAVPALSSTILLESFQAFHDNHHYFHVDIEEKQTNVIIEEVRQSRINVGMIYLNEGIQQENPDLTFKTLLEAQVYVLVSNHSPLASREKITPHDLLDQSNITFHGEYVKSFYEEISNKYGNINILFTTNNMDIIRKTVAKGKAITLILDLPNKNKHYIDTSDITAIPFVINNKPVMKLMGYVIAKKNISKTAKVFLNIVKEKTLALNTNNIDEEPFYLRETHDFLKKFDC
ncbi:LysR family transcriptional regulator [Solibacillus sp. FSL K6-1523]|uniref:LysR family transcriptional regulator n=1 Tax=Solibacillus sp. FSL K6-1523 TaxID=2921471 RepID=UPI0030F887E7